MSKRILIFSASAGSGHLSAARALESTFRSDSRVAEVVHKDALEFSNRLFRDFYSKLYDLLVQKTPHFLGWWYEQSDEPWKTDDVRVAFDRLNAAPLIKYLREYQPDIVVCTHFMPAGVIGHLIERGKVDARLAIVVTDFDFHAMWLTRTFHRYFVAIEETRVHLEILGLPPDRITVSGIPIDPIFGEPVDRGSVLRGLDLQPETRTLLLSAGTLGSGATASVVKRLQSLDASTQVIVVCGKNAELKTQVDAQVAKDSGRFAVLGYTDRMADLVRSADLFIGKPGGLTTAETLAAGLPMAIVSPIPGQEERNSDHLLEEGVAIKCNELTTLPHKIGQLLADPPRLARMRERALALGRPGAARTICDTLLGDSLPPWQLSEETREQMTRAHAGDQ